MKPSQFIIVILLATFLASCAPGTATPAPTLTVISSTTFEPTITPTPAPESLADAPALSTWVEEYVHAYGGKVTVNGVEMDAQQLTEDIRIKPDKFTQFIQAQGINYSIIVVNETPLAIGLNGNWQKSTLRLLGHLSGITFGTETGENFTDTAWQRIQSENFDECVIGAGIYWDQLEQEKGNSDFSIADSQVKWLSKGNCRIIGYHLISNYPDWLLQENFTKDELTVIMRERITTLMTRYPEITEWVVVNEPYLPQYRETDVYYKTWGDYNYIITAFEIAREVNPNAVLIYNDTDNHWQDGVTRNLTRTIISKIKEKNLVDFVGFQMHLYEWENGLIDNRQLTTFADEIDFYKSINVPVKITELDYLGSKTEINTSPDSFNKRLAAVYKRVIEIAISNNLTHITFWGLNDKYSWLNTYDPSLNGQRVNGTLFDEYSRPKMAYYEVLKVLYEHLP